MRYHLDTIPVWDAIKLADACPLCALRYKTEHMLTERFLGGSVMEPDTRIKVNERGFCPRHHRMLYAEQNRLGHALMLQSHLDALRKKISDAFEQQMDGKGPSFFNRFRTARPQTQSAQAGPLTPMLVPCILCESLLDNMNRYAYTFLHLHEHDRAFRETFLQGQGLCLKDVDLVLCMARETLHGAAYRDLIADLKEKTLAILDKNKQDIDWFTQKFDYRNTDKPWGESKEALMRTINFLRGYTLGEEPWKKEK